MYIIALIIWQIADKYRMIITITVSWFEHFPAIFRMDWTIEAVAKY